MAAFIGIIVGAAVGAALLVGLLYCCCCKKRKVPKRILHEEDQKASVLPAASVKSADVCATDDGYERVGKASAGKHVNVSSFLKMSKPGYQSDIPVTLSTATSQEPVYLHATSHDSSGLPRV